MQEQVSKGHSPIIPAHESPPEITFRVLLLGVILTVVLAAANAYLGLKVGTTVSASIPAAVISMGILRFCRNANILENTMVQTMASVGESLTAGIAFILPALIILGAWKQFDYWQTVVVGLIGGGLGVLFTIPLRRALLQDKTLRYPEGVAIGNVLKASEAKEEGDLKLLTIGGLVGAVIELCQTGLQVFAASFSYWFKAGTSVYGFGLGLSPALIAAGYIVGVNVSLSLLLGIFIGWIAGIPVLSAYFHVAQTGTAVNVAHQVWSDHVRYIGVGAMLIGGLWTLLTLIKPVGSSLVMSLQTLKKIRLGHVDAVLRTERDIPIHYVLIGVILIMLPVIYIIANVVITSEMQLATSFRYTIAIISALYILIGGFIFCSIMAYFAGLIGSTNSPVSGLLVSSLLVFAFILLGVFSFSGSPVSDSLGVIVAIGSSVIIGAALAISNDTMQDLKVGEIVGATPWKQQLMLVVGVVVASFVVPPILQLLFNAYGIGGVFPREGMDPSQMLAAPQAGLMATVAKGAFSHNLEWSMIITGMIAAVFSIIIDQFLQKQYGARLPVLAVGLGIYLPLYASMPVVIGGLISYVSNKKLHKMYAQKSSSSEELLANKHRHRGLLLCCGIVAGASIMGVLLAVPFAISESTDAIRIMPVAFEDFAGILGLIATFIFCGWIYRVVVKKDTKNML